MILSFLILFGCLFDHNFLHACILMAIGQPNEIDTLPQVQIKPVRITVHTLIMQQPAIYRINGDCRFSAIVSDDGYFVSYS